MSRSILLALVATLALSAVATASASAETHEWLLNEKPVTESTPVTFTLHFFEAYDKGGPIITCGAVSGKGTVAPKGAGSITEFKLSKCYRTTAGYACKSQTRAEQESTEWMRMIHLSWPTKLTEKYSEDWVEEGKGGAMGFEWECTTVLGTKFKDKCEAGPISHEHAPYGTYVTSLHNEGETVFQEFKGLLGPTPPLDCSYGGLNSGEFYATIVLKGPEGKKLSFK